MKVRLSNYSDHFGVKTEIDGRELPEVRDITLRCDVGAVPVLRVSMFAADVDVELDAQVIVQPIAVPGYDVVIEEGPNGSKRLMARRKNDA